MTPSTPMFLAELVVMLAAYALASLVAAAVKRIYRRLGRPARQRATITALLRSLEPVHRRTELTQHDQLQRIGIEFALMTGRLSLQQSKAKIGGA